MIDDGLTGIGNGNTDGPPSELAHAPVQRSLELVLARELDVSETLRLARRILHEADRRGLEIAKERSELLLVRLEREVADEGGEGGDGREGELLARGRRTGEG